MKKRVHLIEFEDLQWFPSFLRNYMTDFLQFLSVKSKLFKPVVPLLDKMIEDTGEKTILDIGSGGGGGLLWIGNELVKSNPELQIIMTDLFPNTHSFERTIRKGGDHFTYLKQPLDALDIPGNLNGVRTFFLSFHHFKQEQATDILQNAIDTRKSIAIFEGQERSLPSLLAMVFSPVSVWLTTPFIRPFKLGRLIFTYVIPLVPLFVMWDGIVSSIRTYSPKELNDLVSGLRNSESYVWEMGRIRSGPGVNIYLTGRPKLKNK